MSDSTGSPCNSGGISYVLTCVARLNQYVWPVEELTCVSHSTVDLSGRGATADGDAAGLAGVGMTPAPCTRPLGDA
eukprot:COSAG04_NODE_30702_length_261_cov_0.641975_1_plen_75_part_10